jgi:hypothetical protein
MNSKSAFVIMPFSGTPSCTEEEWTEIYEEVFKPAFVESGYACRRATPSTGSLIESIVGDLNSAWVVLADLTDCNPNVFYELGVRHALKRRTIAVMQSFDAVPSDLKGYWSLPYGTRPAQVNEFKRRIREILAQIEDHPEKSDNPVSDYLNHLVTDLENPYGIEILSPSNNDPVEEHFSVMGRYVHKPPSGCLQLFTVIHAPGDDEKKPKWQVWPQEVVTQFDAKAGTWMARAHIGNKDPNLRWGLVAAMIGETTKLFCEYYFSVGNLARWQHIPGWLPDSSICDRVSGLRRV